MKKRLVSIFAICAMLASPAAALADYETEEAVAEETVADAVQFDMQAEYEAMLEEAKEQADIRKVIASEENGDIQLMAANEVTLSGTVTLPRGVTAQKGDVVYLGLMPIDKDENGKILNISSDIRGTRVEFAEGAGSAAYSLKAPKGDYIVRINTYSISNPAVFGGNIYYTSNGYADDERFGEVQTLNANKTLSIEIPAPKHTVSGTITLPEAAAEDTRINISSSLIVGNLTRSNTSGSVTIKKGQTSADYTLGLFYDGIYYMYLYNDKGSGYYSIYGDTCEYNERMYFDTSKGDMTGMDVLFNPVPYDDTENDDNTPKIPVTITLPEASEGYGGYDVEIEQVGEAYAYGYANFEIEPGQKTLKADLPVYYDDEPADFVISVYDYYNDITMYCTADGGVTTNYDNARVFNTSSIDQIKSLNIRIPKMIEVTGTVNRNGFMEGEYANLRVSGTTEDGEIYGAAVTIPADSDTAQYAMLIPEKYINSEFSVQTRLNGYGYARRIVGDRVTLKFTGGNASASVNAPDSDNICKVKGTLYLPAAAPENGVLLEITTGEGYEANPYIIPEGKTEVNIDTYIAVEDPTDVDLGIQATTIDGETFAEYRDIIDTTSEDIVFAMEKPSEGEEVTVSGKVSLPQGVTLTNGLSYRVYIYTNYGSQSIYNSIFKNESEASYSVKIPKGRTINRIELRVTAAGGSSIYDRDLYYTPDGTVTEYPDPLDITADDDMTGIDFELMRGLLISGTIKTPDGAQLPKNAEVYVRATQVNSYGSIASCTIDSVTQNEIPYSLVLNPQFTGDVNISYSVSDDSHTYNSGYYYYSSNGPVTSDETADVITVNGADITGKDLLLVKNKAAINLSAQTAYGIPANVPIYLYVYIDDEYNASTWVNIEEGSKKSDENVIEIPDITDTADITSFKLYYRAVSYGEYDNQECDDYNYEYVYINPDGACTQYADQAQEFGMENKDVTFTVYPSSYYAAEAADKGELTITDANVTRTEDGLYVRVLYSSDAPIDYTVKAIVCAYDNNNRLLGTACGNATILSNYDDVWENIDIPANLTGDKYRLYLWNNTRDITPLHTPFELTELDSEQG